MIHTVIAGLPEMMVVGDKSDCSVIVHSIVLTVYSTQSIVNGLYCIYGVASSWTRTDEVII